MVDGVVVDNGLMTFSARTATRQAVCPGCGTVSGRVHGGYRRRLADVAVSGHRDVIDLLVRRFICPAQKCDRRTFVEQVDGLTERFARRTTSLHRTLEKIALALAGRPESLRDMVASVMETNLSVQANRMNLIMKKVTSWAAIIAVPTAITGCYGQNLPYPGFGHPAGFIVSSSLIVTLSAALYVTFKQKDWL